MTERRNVKTDVADIVGIFYAREVENKKLIICSSLHIFIKQNEIPPVPFPNHHYYHTKIFLKFTVANLFTHCRGFFHKFDVISYIVHESS